MGFKDQYSIPFAGLALGNHHFEYQIDQQFFESFEFSEIHKGNVTIQVDLDRQDRMLVFTFGIQGTVTLPCDRCCDPVEMKVDNEDVLYVKFGEDFHEESAEVIIIPKTEHRFDLSALIYEMILLSLPYQRVHPDDDTGNSTCNPDILRRLKELGPDKDIDPRWEGLKGIHLTTN